MERRREVKGTILTLLGASCWGCCACAGKYVTSTMGVDPVWMVTLRLILAGSILLIVGLFQTRGKGMLDIWKDRKSVIRLVAVAALAFAVCQTTYFAAIDFSNAGIATAMQQTAPAFVLLWVMLKEKRLPTLKEITILLIVLIGGFLLATNGDFGKLTMPLIALVLALISAVTSAMYSIMPRPLLIRYGTFPAVGWGMLLAGLLLVPVAKLWIPSGTWDHTTVMAFAFVVLIGTVVAFGTYLYGVTIVGSVKGSIYGLLEPVVAAIVSATIMHTSFTMIEIIGIALILGAIAALNIGGGRS